MKDILKTCKYCGYVWSTGTSRNKHLKSAHNKTFEDYIIEFVYNGERPKCKCGCGHEMKFKNFAEGPWFNDYTKNHFPHKLHTSETKNKIREGVKRTFKSKYGVENVFVLPEIKEKAAQKKMQLYGDKNYNNPDKQRDTLLTNYGVANSRYLVKNVKTSSIETIIIDELSKLHSVIKKPIIDSKEFDFQIGNEIFEIDGKYFHPDRVSDCTLTQLNNLINDKIKTSIISNTHYSLHRIRAEHIDRNNVTLSSIYSNVYVPNYDFNFRDVIISKDYFKQYIQQKGVNKLRSYIPMLLKFVRTFHPDFAYPDTIENLVDIQSKIKKFNYTVTDNVFNNNTSNIGVSFLKSSFKSYWHSKYNKNQKTPVEVWHDDEFMKKVIEYRIGCNTSNEIFDFSLHQLLRGISAYRHTISFFKPIVAANIYKHFLGDIDAPIVIDPCAGFGGRLLGFKSMYPNGTYIGIEPNIDTFTELQELAKNFTNVELYNCKLEEYTGSKECDLAFTSIPYFDTEIYSNHVRYDSIDSWQREFIGSLLTYNNLVVNMSPDIETLFPEPKGKMYLQNQTSHFNKNSKSKLEPILVY